MVTIMGTGMDESAVRRLRPDRARHYGIMPRRSVTQWSIRVLLAIVAACIGAISVTNSVAEIIKNRDPERALALAPGNARISAKLASKYLADGTADSQRKAAELARSALQRDPTTVEAVAVLGLQAQAGHKPGVAKRLFAYSQRLSRRDLQTQIWAIEDAVARGDIPEVLHHYDIALRTSKVAPDLLFPILADALAEPLVRGRLISLLHDRTPWGAYFVSYLSGSGRSRVATARFLTELKRANVDVPAGAVSVVVNGLLADKSFDEGWHLYATFHSGANRRQSRDPWFAGDVVTPSAFDWTPVNDGVVSTSIQRDGRRGLFEYVTPPGVGGKVLTQVQVLPAGRYRLSSRTSEGMQSSQASPYWTLTCSDEREVARIIASDVATDGRLAVSEAFEVPPGCPFQTLALIVPASDEMAGRTGRIGAARINPVN